jgi:hypothetical protein
MSDKVHKFNLKFYCITYPSFEMKLRIVHVGPEVLCNSEGGIAFTVLRNTCSMEAGRLIFSDTWGQDFRQQ